MSRAISFVLLSLLSEEPVLDDESTPIENVDIVGVVLELFLSLEHT